MHVGYVEDCVAASLFGLPLQVIGRFLHGLTNG